LTLPPLFQKLSHLWAVSFLLLFQICDVPKVVIVNKNILAKFGYKKHNESENFKHSLIIVVLATYSNPT
jgi:hypothetical protein